MRYIIVPKLDEAAESLSETDVRLDPQSRLENYESLVRMRRDIGMRRPLGLPPATVELESAAQEMAGPDHAVRVVASPDSRTVATGVTIIDTDEAGAEAINAQLPEADVIPDEELELIAPEISADGATSDASALTEAELWHLEAIGLKAARAGGFTGTGTGITVAVLDTGIADVPEINGKVTHAVELDTETWRANVLPKTKDTTGHGTHVAGLIVGDKVGVAPGARLANVMMIPNGAGKTSDYILALEWVASKPEIAILNMSAGKRGFHGHMRIMAQVMRRLRTVAIMAIGNEGANTSRSPGNYPEVISVGASNASKKVWSGSGGGSLSIDHMNVNAPKLVAPGQGVTSCVMTGDYQSWNGTSMATPIVSGIACLVLEREPNISLTDLEARLMDSCHSLGEPVERQGRGEARVPPSILQAEA